MPLRVRQAMAVLLLGGAFAGALSLALGARLDRAQFTYNNGTEVSTLDPATVTGQPEGRVIRAIFEGLVIKDPKTLAPLPGMAESWEISQDGLVYTFHVRRNAKWTNGDPVTAHDFTFSAERFLNPVTAAEYSYQLWYVKGAKAYTTEVDDDGKPVHDFDSVAFKALDDFTIEIELNSPTPFFLDIIGFYPLFPVNRRNIEEAQENWPERWEIEWLRPANIVTNGPYKVAYRRVNDRIRLVKNHDYWDADHVAFESIDVLAIEHYGTMMNLYLTGGVDWIDRVAPNIIPRILPREDFRPTPFLSSYFYRVNVTRPPMDDPLVRRALSLAIDRQTIVDKIMKAGQLPAYALVPPGITGYVNAELQRGTGESGDAFEADVALAQELLAQAGYGPGGKPFPTIEIHYNTSEAHRDIALVIANGWKRRLGIDAKLLNQEWKVYLDTQSNLGYDISRSGWIADYADPNTYLDLFLTNGENNKTGWGNPEYDRLIAAAAKEFDPEVRMRIMHDAEAILMDEMPIFPIYYYVSQSVVAPRMGGWFNNVQDEHFPKFWYWMDDEELAEKRAQQPTEWELVDPHGPSEGLYSPAQVRERRAR